jgi:hypothetical protein
MGGENTPHPSKRKRSITHKIFVDSSLVINCINGKQSLHTFSLQPILEDIRRLLSSFHHATSTHVYRRWNQEADDLTKDGLDLDLSCWKTWEERPPSSTKNLCNIGPTNASIFVVVTDTTISFFVDSLCC